MQRGRWLGCWAPGMRSRVKWDVWNASLAISISKNLGVENERNRNTLCSKNKDYCL